MIRIVNLCKNFSDQTILHNINLNISEGEIHGVIGSSGVGKSTLLRCINGLEPYQSGNLFVDGVDVKKLQPKDLRAFRKKIGMIFQNFALLESKTAYDNILLPMQCWGYAKSYMHEKAQQLLSLVGLTEKAHCFPRELSGGQKQRVAIARTLALDPSILLCDEATSALDPQTAKSILKLLKEINEKIKITIIIVTHQLEVVKEICHRLSIIENKTITLTDQVGSILLKEPKAFSQIAGSSPAPIPKDCACIKMVLQDEQIHTPIFANLAQQIQLSFNIIYAKTETCANACLAIFYITFAPDKLKQVMQFLKQQKIWFITIEQPIPQ